MATPAASLPLVRELQAALTVAEIQQAYMGSVGDVIFARGRGLYRVDLSSQTFIDQVADVPEPFLHEYASFGLEDDPVLEAAITGMRPVASSERTVVPSWSGSRAHEALLHFGYTHSLKAPLLVGGVLWGSIHFTRYVTDPPFDAADQAAAALVVDQLGIALTRALRHEETSGRAQFLEAALNCIPQPVIVTDRIGRLVHRNRAAEKPGPTDRRPIGDVVSSTISHAAGLLEAENRRVVTSAVERDDGDPVSLRTMAVGDSAAVTIVYAKAGAAGPALPALGILSPREQEIARFVSEGLPTKEIAARAFITENTVKQHLKRIFMKLNVRSRAELVQCVWAAAAGPPTPALPDQA
ncbi:helix-turn-helix transcriptional regulator [Nitriliruptor alkaliphilus]|uniref:helix-turn-helix transcriptional regulator n=1 Tax=Nitriliruptor alkaliphilus TaxID=427918 RepID=UPI000697648A|nr:helix-turn-helix transcriptional regulator [Nitriliruptor alkaliphilus]